MRFFEIEIFPQILKIWMVKNLSMRNAIAHPRLVNYLEKSGFRQQTVCWRAAADPRPSSPPLAFCWPIFPSIVARTNSALKEIKFLESVSGVRFIRLRPDVIEILINNVIFINTLFFLQIWLSVSQDLRIQWNRSAPNIYFSKYFIE